MLIRKLLPADAAAFHATRLRGLREVPSAFTATYAEEADTPLTVVAERLEPVPNGAVLGAFEGGTLLGVLGVVRERQRQRAHKALLWGMYVQPESRGKGVGAALVTRALEVAAELGVRSVQLGVNTRNAAAIALYRRLGFQVDGTEPGYLLVDGELHDEYFMSRPVGDAPVQRVRSIRQVGATPIQLRHRALCHCGAVEIELHLPEGIVDPRHCDCSICRRKGAVVASVPLTDLRVVRGHDVLRLYQFNTRTAKHYFCSVCGIYTHHQRRSSPDLYGYNVGCLEGVNPFDLGPVKVYDGVHHPADRTPA